jgi:uncharacterized protein YgiM (DUF1202 family)
MTTSSSEPTNTRIATTFGAAVTRRSFVRTIFGIGAAAALAPALGLITPATARSSDSLIVNTAGARLRSGAGTGYAVIASLPKGTEVRYLADGGTANGYRWYKVRVLATGKEGFVAASLLSAPSGGTGTDPVIVGSAATTASVNLRSGPSTSNSVLRVVPAGTAVQISNTVQNGFRYVIHNGLAGWIVDQFLSVGGSQPGPVPTYQTTTANLNLRAEPSSTAKVLLVIPSGSQVRPNGAMSNGFAQVNYNGTVGWAAAAYLK